MNPSQTEGVAAFESDRRFYGIDDMRVAPDGLHVAGGCWFGQRGLYVWRFGSGDDVPDLVLRSTREAVRCVRFRSDGAQLLAAYERSVRVWDLRSGKPRALTHELDAEVAGIAFAPDGWTYAVVAGGRLRAMRTLPSPGGESDVLASATVEGRALAFLDDRTLLVSQRDRIERRAWPELEVVGSWRIPRADVRCVEVSEDRAWVGIAAYTEGRMSGVVHFLHAETGRIEHTLHGDIAAPSSIAFSRDGTLAATVRARREIVCLRLGSWEISVEGRGAPEALSSVGFWPDGRRVVAAGRDPRRGPPVLAWPLPGGG